MAPSVRNLFREFTKGHIYSDTYPVIRSGIRMPACDGDHVSAWASALEFSSAAMTPQNDPASLPFIPISTAHHDSSQLVWGREQVPLCDSGEECEALRYSGNQGCLHAYLSPEQQRCLDNGEPFDMPDPAFCLLCIRCEIHALLLAWDSLVSNPRQQTGRDILCVPPMQNLVDVPGGYVRSAVGISQSAHSVIANVAVVGVTGLIDVKYNPATKKFYFDQSRIVWPNQHFLR
jgi:hypothetical protein